VPKLWQGRPKLLPKRLAAEDMLKLDTNQLSRLCDYVVNESTIRNDQSVALNRVNLLLRCCAEAEGFGDDCSKLSIVVNKLRPSETLIKLLYLKRPLAIGTNIDVDSCLIGASPWDSVLLTIITSIGASTQRGKEAGEKIKMYGTFLRRIATRTPSLLLRHVSLLAPTLRGRTLIKFVIFRLQHNLQLFTLTLDLMQMLSPGIFHPRHAPSLQDMCLTFGEMFSTYAEDSGDMLKPLLTQYCVFLLRYLSANSADALKVANGVQQMLHQMTVVFPDVRIVQEVLKVVRFGGGIEPASSEFKLSIFL
jgi:hypothetical protein